MKTCFHMVNLTLTLSFQINKVENSQGKKKKKTFSENVREGEILTLMAELKY